MQMRLMLLGGGSALGQALIRLGAEEDIGFLAPRPPENGWDSANLTQLLDDTRPMRSSTWLITSTGFSRSRLMRRVWPSKGAPVCTVQLLPPLVVR